MDSYERLSGISLSAKKQHYINLTMEDITDANYKYAKNVWQNFGIKTPYESHDLYVESNTLLLEDKFESLHNKYIKMYKVDCAHFFLASMLEEGKNRNGIVDGW